MMKIIHIDKNIAMSYLLYSVTFLSN